MVIYCYISGHIALKIDSQIMGYYIKDRINFSLKPNV